MNCPSDGLVIGADNIVVDLNGHTIDGDAVPGVTQPDRGIRLAAHHGVTLTGGTVQEFDTGVLLDNAIGNRIRRMYVLRNAPGRGIDLENHSDNNQIEANTSANNARSGIALIESDGNLLRDNTTRENPLGGIIGVTTSHTRVEHNTSAVSLDNGSNDNVITGNSATGLEFGIAINGDRNLVSVNHVFNNSANILVGGNGNTVVANVIRDAVGCEDNGCGTGIAVEGGTGNLIAGNNIARSTRGGITVNTYEIFGGTPTVGTVIRDNIVRDAATDAIGIATDLGAGGTIKDTTVKANLVTGSTNDGINVASATTTITRNLALRNGNLGIEAVKGATDGGGNHAFGNGNPAQCTNNIAC